MFGILLLSLYVYGKGVVSWGFFLVVFFGCCCSLISSEHPQTNKM